jgi:hypothetical protein
MGMDIHGLNPVMRSEMPTIDWNASTDEERTIYFELREKFEQENPGVYFRANVWAWRPIAEIILDTNNTYKLGYDSEFINGIHLNQGAGLITQEECNVLANCMEKFMDTQFPDWDTIGLNSGWYYSQVVDKTGKVHMSHLQPEEEAKISTFLGTTKYIKNGEIEMNEFIYRPAHNVTKQWLKEFISFLRECGGFEIL